MDIISGHGPKEVKTTWRVSTNPPFDHMTSNDTGKEYEIIEVHLSNPVFILNSVDPNVFLCLQVRWYL